ncbi:MAG: LAGLIDADG family homing endonuclease [archaeon]
MNKKFDNNLVGLKDLSTPSFYILLTKDYREFLIKKALNNKKDFKSIAQEIGCCVETLKNFKNYKEKHINSKFLKNLLSLLDIPINDAEKHVLSIKRGCSNRDVKLRLPIKAKPELALLMAKAFGDGSVLSDWRFHYTNTQLNLIKEVINAVTKSIGKTRYTLHKRSDRKIYEIKFSPVVGYILNLIGAPKSYKINQEFRIPNWIMDGDKNTKSYFLRGIFDDESCVNKSGRSKRILLAMGKINDYEDSLRNFLEQIQKLLLEFDISTGSIHIQQRYGNKVILRFGIYKKTNFENFKMFIDFTHTKKKRIIKDIINSYIDTHKTKKMVLETLKDVKYPLTTNEIAKLNKLRRRNAYEHLNNLFKEDIIKKIEVRPTMWFKN